MTKMEYFYPILIIIYISPLTVGLKRSTARLCDDHTKELSCTNGKTLWIVSATYKLYTSADACETGADYTCQEEVTTSAVKEKCNQKTSCELRVDWTAGCPGAKVKVLDVVYYCTSPQDFHNMCGFDDTITVALFHTPGFQTELDMTDACVAKIYTEDTTTETVAMKVQVLQKDLPDDIEMYICDDAISIRMDEGTTTTCTMMEESSSYTIYPGSSNMIEMTMIGGLQKFEDHEGVLLDITVLAGFTMCEEDFTDALQYGFIRMPTPIPDECDMTIKPSKNDIRLTFTEDLQVLSDVSCGGVLYGGDILVKKGEKTYCEKDQRFYSLDYYGDVELTIQLRNTGDLREEDNFVIEYELTEDTNVEFTTSSSTTPYVKKTTSRPPAPHVTPTESKAKKKSDTNVIPIVLGSVLGFLLLVVLIIILRNVYKNRISDKNKVDNWDYLEKNKVQDKSLDDIDLTMTNPRKTNADDKQTKDDQATEHPNFKSLGIYKPTYF